MLRIWVSDSSEDEVTLKLEGQVIGPWTDELQRLCDRVLARGGELTLDLADVSFIDREGLALFRSLAEQPVAVVNCSPFVASQLDGR